MGKKSVTLMDCLPKVPSSNSMISYKEYDHWFGSFVLSSLSMGFYHFQHLSSLQLCSDFQPYLSPLSVSVSAFLHIFLVIPVRLSILHLINTLHYSLVSLWGTSCDLHCFLLHYLQVACDQFPQPLVSLDHKVSAICQQHWLQHYVVNLSMSMNAGWACS